MRNGCGNKLQIGLKNTHKTPLASLALRKPACLVVTNIFSQCFRTALKTVHLLL